MMTLQMSIKLQLQRSTDLVLSPVVLAVFYVSGYGLPK